jgi:hypothetical protein
MASRRRKWPRLRKTGKPLTAKHFDDPVGLAGRLFQGVIGGRSSRLRKTVL